MWPAEGSRGHMHKTQTEACSRLAGARGGDRGRDEGEGEHV